MGYLLLITGLVLMALTFRETLSRLAAPDRTSSTLDPFQASSPAVIDDLRLLHAKVDLLAETVGEVAVKIEGLEVRGRGGDDTTEPEIGFEQVLAGERHADLYRQVYQAFDAGKDVTEIARDMARGKGEIELILSLRR